MRRIPSASCDVVVVERDAGGRYGDDPVTTRMTSAVRRFVRAVGRRDLDGVRVEQASGAAHQVDAVPVDVRVDPLELQSARPRPCATGASRR